MSGQHYRPLPQNILALRRGQQYFHDCETERKRRVQNADMQCVCVFEGRVHLR